MATRVHAFRLVNNKGETVFAKFHWKSQQGLKGMTLEETKAADTNYATKDLYQNISAGNFPKRDLYVQLLTPQQVAQLSYDGFDDTKVWSDVPEAKVGTMTLNKVPDNYFDYTEESRVLPVRDGARHRGLTRPDVPGPPVRLCRHAALPRRNQLHAAAGKPPRVQVSNNNIDGAMQSAPRQGDVNYEPTSVSGNPAEQPDFRYSQYAVTGMTQQKPIEKQDNFRQAGEFYRALSKGEQDNLIKNLSADLGQVKSMQTKEAMVGHFYQAGQGLRHAAGCGRRRGHQVCREDDVRANDAGALTNIGRGPRARGPSLLVQGTP